MMEIQIDNRAVSSLQIFQKTGSKVLVVDDDPFDVVMNKERRTYFRRLLPEKSTALLRQTARWPYALTMKVRKKKTKGSQARRNRLWTGAGERNAGKDISSS